MRRALLIALCLALSGCGLPAASVVSLIAASITLATHVADDGTQIYLQRGKDPAPVKPTP